MKKYIYLILSAILCVPFIVNAETLTYEVCESGCEYTNLWDVETAINNISDLSDKDIVINVNSDIANSLSIGDFDNVPNSVTINGNNHDINSSYLDLLAKNITINNCNNLQTLTVADSDKINIKNSNIKEIQYMSIDSNHQIKSDEINLLKKLNIDETSSNNLKTLFLLGNFKIENLDFKNIVLVPLVGTINIYNSKLNKIVNVPDRGKIIANIYNSTFNSLKYVNITSEEDTVASEFIQYVDNTLDSSVLSYDVYDLSAPEYSNTTVYFDKETKLKPNNKLNLVSYLDYYTEDKEIEYTIEDESIAKIENKELSALKEGSTKVTVTTDEGHVIYRINLTVEKETIPEKIDKMTIKVPITGSKIKAWVVVVSILLLGVIGVCSYILIKRKK